MKRSHAGYHLTAAVMTLAGGVVLLLGATPAQLILTWAAVGVVMWMLAALDAL